MKKIIYSLVIMIAAGSLFTSCVTNTEPQGVKDLREAKADYIESLAKLNAAKEALVAAEAAYKNAEATVEAAKVAVVEAQAAKEQAKAAQEQARVDVIKAQAAEQEIKNAKAQAELEKQIALDSIEVAQALLKAANYEVYSKAELEAQIKKFESEIAGYEEAIAKAESKIAEYENAIAEQEAKAEKIAVDAETALVNAQKALIAAQEQLARQENAFLAYLYQVEIGSYVLTTEEKNAVAEYKAAYDSVVAAKQWVRKVEEIIFDFDTLTENKYAKKLQGLQDDVTEANADIEFYQDLIASYGDTLNMLADSGKIAETVAALEAKYEKDNKDLMLAKANVKKEWDTYKATELDAPITGFASELTKWVVDNAAIPAPFDMHFKAELPDNGAVSALFKASVEKFYTTEDEESDSPVKVDDGYIYANFKTSADALYGVYALDSIIDAISRKYIIDSVGVGGLDTVGLAKAVDDAEEEYAAVAAALEAGLKADTAYDKAAKALAQAVEDTVAAKRDTVDAYAAKHEADSLYTTADTTYKKYLGEEGIVAKATNDSIAKGGAYTTDTIALNNAKAVMKNSEKALEAYKDSLTNADDNIEAAGILVYRVTNAKEKAETAKNAAETEYTQAQTDSSAAATAFKNDLITLDSLNIVVDKAKVAKEKADNAAKEFNKLSDSLITVTNAYNAIKDKDSEYFNSLIATAKSQFSTDSTAFAKKDSTAKASLDTLNKYVGIYNKAVADSTKFGEDFRKAKADTAAKNKDLAESKEKFNKSLENYDTADENYSIAFYNYYKNVYCKFWGLDTTGQAFTNLFDGETGFLNDSIPYKDFTETFKKAEANDIVKFEIDRNNFYKDGKFNFDKEGEKIVNLISNAEIEIILEQLKAHKVADFEATLLCQLFAKQQYKDDIFAAVGSIDNNEALDALKGIKDKLAEEFDKASAKQEAASEPFFKFVQGLFGEDCLNTIFTNLDNALKAYAPYVNEPVSWGNKFESKLGVIAKIVGTEKVTSKQLFTWWFEYEMCNVESSLYRTAYIALQVAGAFSGDQFKTLITDVLTSVIQSMGDYKIKVGEDEKEMSIKDLEFKTDIIETLLFGSVQGVTFENILDFIEVLGSDIDINKKTKAAVPENITKYVNIAYKAVQDFQLIPYLTKDFGGKLAELQAKYFADWAQAWEGYQAEIVGIDAKLYAIQKLQYVLNAYEKDDTVAGLIKDTKAYKALIAIAEENLATAEETLALAEEALEAYVGGPALWEQHKAEHLADVLAAAKTRLAIAEEYLKIATAAYEAVLANHKVTE